MARGQRWKVTCGSADGIRAREGRDAASHALLERLPEGAVVEELELEGDCLHFKRVSGVGPLTGWASISAPNGQEQLSRMAARAKSEALAAAAPRRTAAKATPKALAQAPPEPQGTGRYWVVVAEEGSVVWKGQRVASLKLRERLPYGCVVEELACTGDRLQFLNSTGAGPATGWLSTAEKGREMLQPFLVPEPSAPETSFEGMKKGFLVTAQGEESPLQDTKAAAEPDAPLGGWAGLSELLGQEEARRQAPMAAVAAETFGRRRPRGELPPVEDLEHLDEAALIDTLGFDETTAKDFFELSPAQKRKMIAEAKALIEMGAEKRLEVLENYKKAWPSGPFPELTPAVEEQSFLPPGTCFPLSRHLSEVPATGWKSAPEWGLQSPAGKAVTSYFQRRAAAAPQAQKEFLRSLRCEVATAAPPLRPEPAARQLEAFQMEGSVDTDQLSGTIVAKGAVRPEGVLSYFNRELSKRICLLDGGLAARIAKEKLGEADYRGERFKNFKETNSSGQPISLQGNLDLLVLTKATLIADIHKEYLLAGSDIVRTNTLGCNALSQQEYKMNKLVYEMNKAAAQLAKKSASEVTKQEPSKPRFVAGVIGPTPCMMSVTLSASWASMVEAYDEQIRGLLDGGVDLLMLEGVTDSLNAKAAIFALDEYCEKAKKKRPPVMVSASIAENGRLPSGQSAEAFSISLRHVRPLSLGLTSSEGLSEVKAHYGSLAGVNSGWCSVTPGAKGSPEDFASALLACAKEGLVNFAGAGGEGATPAHIAALAKQLGATGGRKLPSAAASPCLALAGLDACLVKPDEGLQIVGSQCTVMGSAKFKKKVGAYKATGKMKFLQEAAEVCLEQCEKGADILDFNLDSDIVASGTSAACPAKSTLSTFLKVVSAEPRVARVPFMLCSCDWETIQEGLKCVQGKCIVNGISLALGEDEFLRIAKECQRFGAAIVVLAITSEGEPAESAEDKVRICKRSYELLRTKLDFPAEDILLDCQLLLLGLPEYATRAVDFMSAVAELKRTCPGASFAAGVNNLSLAFRGLNMLRDALHSTFLYHAVPKGLNMAITWAGALPPYSDIDAETRTLCDEVVLNASPDGRHLERFSAYVNFRSNSLTCLPFQHPGLGSTPDQRGVPGAVQKEAREIQKRLLVSRKVSSPEQQKSSLRSMRSSITSGAEYAVKPARGAGLADPCRLEGTANREGLASTITAKSGVRPSEAAKYLGAELGKRVCLLATPSAEKKMAEADYRDFFAAGCDVCGTGTLLSASYEECKAAAQAAKSAAAESTKKDSGRPRFVAGVVGPMSGSLLSAASADDASGWNDLVSSYMQIVRGLVDGGADLLSVEMVSDTLNAKAAVYAVDEYFEQSGKERLPLLITAVLENSGKVPSGQSMEAFIISLRHAKPLSLGLHGELGQGPVQAACRALAEQSFSYTHATGSASSLEELSSSGKKLGLNLLGAYCGDAAQVKRLAAVAASAATARNLPPVDRSPSLKLAGLEAHDAGNNFQVVGQRCNAGACKSFKGFVDAYKYTKEGNRWQHALDVCKRQVEDGADILDCNFDSALVDSQLAMRKFLRLCGSDDQVAKRPFVLSSMKWPVIEEGLRSVQGKCIVNAISLAQGEEEFLRLAKACQRYGAAVVVMTIETMDPEQQVVPSVQEKVRIGQEAYRLLRSRLDFPAEDIIIDCCVLPVNVQSVRDFLDALAELKRTCPLASFVAGVGNLSIPYRAAPPLREALHSMFLYNAIPLGLNMAIMEPGAVPLHQNIEAQTKTLCEEAVGNDSGDGSHMERLENYAAYLSGSAAEEIPVALVPKYDVPEAITRPKRPSPSLTQPIHTLVQGTGTINASIFQTFGSKAHTATIFHKNQMGLAVKRQVWFSSISAWMGQGGSGPITGASAMMDGISLHERWQGLQNTGVSVEWGAIGEIGLRRTIYGSRDVFAQFDLGQKLIGPADTQFLMRACCCAPADPYEVIGLAYLDQTWQMTLAGATAAGGLERKTFADM